MNIFDKIIEEMAAFEAATGIEPKYIYLGSNTIWELHKELEKRYNIFVTGKFVCDFFNAAEVFIVYKENHINVC